MNDEHFPSTEAVAPSAPTPPAIIGRVTLASASPRRLELLRRIGIEGVVVVSDAHEESVTVEGLVGAGISRRHAPAEVALRRARLKAAAVAIQPGTVGLLAADTVVAIHGESLEKPQDRADARRMLRMLSGERHEVFTAVVFRPADGSSVIEDIVTTEVHVLPLSPAEIERYLDTQEWNGVAGGYRIQGAAAAFIPQIDGSYGAVVGLPIGRVYSIIRRFLDVDSLPSTEVHTVARES